MSKCISYAKSCMVTFFICVFLRSMVVVLRVVVVASVVVVGVVVVTACLVVVKTPAKIYFIQILTMCKVSIGYIVLMLQ